MQNQLKEKKVILYPKFKEIQGQNWKEQLEQRIFSAKKILNTITKEDSITEYSQKQFNIFLEQITLMEDLVDRYFGVVGHLNAVVNDASKREVYQQCLQILNEFHNEVIQNKDLYYQFCSFQEAMGKIAQDDKKFSPIQKKIIGNFILDFKREGIHLEEEEKKKLLDIQQTLSKNSADFFNNVLDDTNEFILFVKEKEYLKEFSQEDLDKAKNLALQKKKIKEGEEGYAFSLQSVDYLNFMKYCSDSQKRKQMYTAYTTKATKGERDNSPILLDSLKKRVEKSLLLNYENHIQYTLVDRMAKTKEEITSFLNDILEKSYPLAQKEIQELKDFALVNGQQEEFSRWDIAYWGEKLKQQKYSYDSSSVRDYFPYKKVLEGLFSLIEDLFDYELKLTEEKAWHKDVQCYEIYKNEDDNKNKTKKLHGILYIDLFTRENKGQGAWVNTFTTRNLYKNGELQLPVGYLICNFSQKNNKGESYLYHDEIVTLFHEMGHALHMCLTEIDFSQVSSGSGVPWDGIELPSQFFENFAWNHNILAEMSEHRQTKEQFPQELYEKLVQSKNFQTGIHYTRQIEFALIDLELHDLSAQQLQQENIVEKTIEVVNQKTNYLTNAGFEKFINGFSHIFSGGYSSGYYSYLWALVYACDAYDAFLTKEEEIDYSMGKKFLNSLLCKGGSKDFKELYFDFRGRQPSIEALLKHNGFS